MQTNNLLIIETAFAAEVAHHDSARHSTWWCRTVSIVSPRWSSSKDESNRREPWIVISRLNCSTSEKCLPRLSRDSVEGILKKHLKYYFIFCTFHGLESWSLLLVNFALSIRISSSSLSLSKQWKVIKFVKCFSNCAPFCGPNQEPWWLLFALSNRLTVKKMATIELLEACLWVAIIYSQSLRDLQLFLTMKIFTNNWVCIFNHLPAFLQRSDRLNNLPAPL